MRFTFLIITFALIFIGCDRRKPPETVNPDLVYDTIPLYEENTSFAPYDFEKFKPVLEQSRLQIFKDSGQSSTVNSTICFHGIFTNIPGIRNLFGKNNNF